MTAEEVADRFDAKRSGEGWKARCPAHDDQHARLHMSGQEFFSPKDTAQWLGISTYTVCELCRRGLLQHARVGRRIRIKREWAEAYMMASAREPRA